MLAAAREDMLVFPAWQTTLSGGQLHELDERFEEIEKQQSGGFDQAAGEIGEVEAALGFADLSRFTAPPWADGWERLAPASRKAPCWAQ